VRLKRYRDKGILNPPSLLGDLGVVDVEEEHVAGRNHDPNLVAPVSVRDHYTVTRNREAAGIRRGFEKDRTKQVVHALKSLSVFLELLSESVWKWAEQLEEECDRHRG
jgi:hypothetical protein